jgi:dipicolinate synthase subunit A
LGSCDQALREADCIFNTVPSMVLPRERLMLLRPGTLVIDLASSPGGVDFEAAKQLGLEAILALGLPGKVAPVSAGRILARHIPALIAGLVAGHSGQGR